MKASELAAILKGYRFNYGNEAQLQEGIRLALEGKGIQFASEVSLTSHDRIDFMVGRTGVEVKVGHPTASVMRQVHRYAQSEQVDEILLITNRCRHAMVAQEINGKRIEVLFLGWGML